MSSTTCRRPSLHAGMATQTAGSGGRLPCMPCQPTATPPPTFLKSERRPAGRPPRGVALLPAWLRTVPNSSSLLAASLAPAALSLAARAAQPLLRWLASLGPRPSSSDRAADCAAAVREDAVEEPSHDCGAASLPPLPAPCPNWPCKLPGGCLARQLAMRSAPDARGELGRASAASCGLLPPAPPAAGPTLAAAGARNGASSTKCFRV